MLLEINRQAVYKSRQWLLWGPMVAGWERAQSSLLTQLKRFYFVIWGVNMWIYSLWGKSWCTLSMYFPICLISFNKILFKGGILLENYLKLQKGSSRNVDHWKPNTWKNKCVTGVLEAGAGIPHREISRIWKKPLTEKKQLYTCYQEGTRQKL